MVSAGFVEALCLAAVPASARTIHVFGSSFGGPRTGQGQFEGPTGVAVEEVALGNNRVEWLGSDGKEFLSEFDGHETPAGSFAGPTAIAIDNSTNPLDPSAGDVYVLDAGHNVIDKFEADGKYLSTVEKGSGEEAFGSLDGVATDTDGRLWAYQASGQIDYYSSGLPNEFPAGRNSPFGASPGFAVDSEDNTRLCGLSTPDASAGGGINTVSVQVHLPGLTGGSVDHLRLTAHNAAGATSGKDLAFTLPAAPEPTSSALPDNRQHELVSAAAWRIAPTTPPLSTQRDGGSRAARLVDGLAGGGQIAPPSGLRVLACARTRAGLQPCVRRAGLGLVRSVALATTTLPRSFSIRGWSWC